MPPGAHNLSARVPTLRWFLALNFFAAFLGIIFRQRTILGIIFSPTDYSTTTLAGSSAEYSATRPRSTPTLAYLRMLVGCVVVDDRVDFFSHRHLRLDGIEGPLTADNF